jgi:hypothetical protein
LQSAPEWPQVQLHLPPTCYPDREAPLVAVPRQALPPEPAFLAGRMIELSARELRRPASEASELRQPVAEAQGVRPPVAEVWELRQLAAQAQGGRQLEAQAQGGRQLVAQALGGRQLVVEAVGVRQPVVEAMGVRQPVAEARALQRAAEAWQAWPELTSVYLFRAGLARPRSPSDRRAPAESTTRASE